MVLQRRTAGFVITGLSSLFLTSRCAAQSQPTTSTTQPATIAVPGNVAAFYSVDLYAKESGYLTELKVDIGDHVKNGDVLAVIDNPELEQQLKSTEALLVAKKELAKAAEAGVEQSKALLDVAKRQLVAMKAESDLAQASLNRQEQLFKEKAATEQQIDEFRAKSQVAVSASDVGNAKVASAKADVRAAEAARAVAAAQVQVTSADLARARTLFGYTKLVAPFDGVITRRLVGPGDLVQAGSMNRNAPLLTCQKVDSVRVLCDVPEASAAAARVGMKADIRLAGALKSITATVTRVSGAMDATTRTMRIEIDLPNPGEGLRPGMYAQVTLNLPQPSDVAQAGASK